MRRGAVPRRRLRAVQRRSRGCPRPVISPRASSGLPRAGYLPHMREQDAISNVDYPATKQDMVAAAVDAEVSQATIEELQALSREQYEDAAAIERELAEMREGTTRAPR